MGQRQGTTKKITEIMAHVAAQTPRKENINVKLPSLNFRQMAESVEVLDKGRTTNIFTIYFF